MPTLSTVSAPRPIIHTDTSGANAAAVATVPPVSGSDYGVPVYANLGSAVIPVSPSNVGVTLHSYDQVSVGATATQILAANTSRAAILVTNNGSQIIYLGDASVTTSTGFPLAAGSTVGLPQTSALYGIVASSTATAGFLEFQ